MTSLRGLTQTAASMQQIPDNVSHGSARREAGKLAVTKKFAWGAGIECSFIPHLNVDQFEWTQHNRFWRDDFKLGAPCRRAGGPRFDSDHGGSLFVSA